MKKILLPLFAMLFILNGCASMSASEKAEKRNELDIMAGSTIMRLLKQFPELQPEVENAAGYLVAYIDTTAAKAGEGVLITSDASEHVYFTIGKLKMGSGWGAHSFKILLVLETQEMLDSFKNRKPEIQTAAAAPEPPVSSDNPASSNNEYTVYVMSDRGVAVAATVRIIDFKINNALTNNQ